MKNNMNLTSLFTVVLAVALTAAPASATVLTYTDLASWQAAVASSSVEDFEGATADTDFTFTPTSSPNGDLVLSAVEESTFTNNMLIDVVPLITSNGEINGDAVLSMRYLSHVSDPADSVTVTLPAGMSAFGFEWKNYDSQADSAEIRIAGTNGQAGPVFTPGTGFYGVVEYRPRGNDHVGSRSQRHKGSARGPARS